MAGILRGKNIDPKEVASIIRGEHGKTAYNQLIHSSLDMDRMDYLGRDSLGTGVPYGHIDLNYLLSNLDVTDQGEVVISHKATTAAEHFVISRYFMFKNVYMHKTVFAFEALLRHILFLLREDGEIYRDGKQIEEMILTDEFLSFHDGYVDEQVNRQASSRAKTPVATLCKALRDRNPPKLVHEVAVLYDPGHGAHAKYTLFTKDRANKIAQLAKKFKIDASRWIWEDPKDIKFESMGPFVGLSAVSDIKPEEEAELIRIRHRNGSIRPLIEDQNSILHHLSQLRFRMSRLYVVGVEDKDLARIKPVVQSWVKSES